MNKKIISNYFYSVLYQLLLVIIPLITLPYTTSRLGLTPLAINTATSNVVQWFALFGIMGINTYGNREIARVRDDKRALSRTFFEIVAMQWFSVFMMAVLFVMYVLIVGDPNVQVLLIQGISLIAVALDITWFFYGVEDFKKVSIRNCFVKIVGVLLIFAFIKKPEDLMLFIVINIVVSIVGQAIMWFQLKGYIQKEKITVQGILMHFLPNIRYFVPQLAISIYSIMDVTMLRTMGPVFEEVTLYEQTMRFIKMFLFFVTSIGTVMLPRLSNIFAKGDMKLVESTINKTFRVSLYLAIPVILGICAVIEGTISWFLPPDFHVIGQLIQWGSPLILFISLSNVFGVQYLLPTGNTKQYTNSVIVGASVNFCLNFIFIPQYGITGALLASVVGEFAVTFYQWLIIRKEIKITMKWKELFIILFSAGMMYGAVWFAGKQFSPSFVVTLFQALTGVGLYGVLLFLFKAPMIQELKQMRKKK